ncbi:protein SNORC [Centroberyx gerrardi]|uniref:protein SNORC n=1 Tax=Centroberyx gerrardi TaxID=166262 RepID=UPI003AAA5A2F
MLEEFRRRCALSRSSLPGTMVHSSSICRFLLLALLGLLVATVHTETVADPAPTLQGDNQDTVSGGGAYDVTTKDPFQDMTERSFTYDYEDSTHSQAMDEEEGVLGPGAITAIVIAVFLGASVLLALIVITLRKFTAS